MNYLSFSFAFLGLFSLSGNSVCDDITEEVFGKTPTHYLPAAFGDFNADKLMDMFVLEKIDDESYLLKVLLSHETSPFLRPTGPECKLSRNVKSVVPSDFDGDGAMDVLVISLQKSFYECYILWGDLEDMNCPKEYLSKATLKSQPLLMDYNGDMIADLFGEDVSGNRSFWVFPRDRSTPRRVPMAHPSAGDSTIEHNFSPLVMSGGHAFVDVDKDLAADLWISTEDHFELWPSQDGFQAFELVNHPHMESLNGPPKVIGQSAFLDMDLDGDIEVIVPLCADVACAQSFIYVHEFKNTTTDKWYDLKVNFKDIDEVTWGFPSGKPSYLYTNIITLRIGDINLDGYPDILVTLFHGNSPMVVSLINSPCSDDCHYPRTFVPHWETFSPWPNSVLGTYFDFHEDGTLDVLLVNTTSDQKTYTMAVYKDSVQYDAMFLKVVVLTGVCYNDCPHHKIPYGTNQAGPSVTYTMTSADGGVRRASAPQLPQSDHFALQLPFVMFGLGRNWNFVDKLTIGIPLAHSSRPGPLTNYGADSKNGSLTNAIRWVGTMPSPPSLSSLTATFTQIIPNSQLVVIPYPKDLPSLWITKLFITPSKAMLMTAGALVATCLFVAAIIGILHLKEKQQDKREKRQQAQRFHFDAM